MTETLTLPFARRTRLVALAARVFGATRIRTVATERDAEQSRARRDFILDKLADNPDAFASEDDLRAMMSVFPHEF